MNLISRACLFIPLLITSCVSYEPRLLVPALTYSPETLNLITLPQSGGVDFGLELTSNESDSLFNVEVLPGVKVLSVNNGGAAESAGIQAGDIILWVDDLETNDVDVIQQLARTTDSEQSFLFTLRRDTTVLEASVTARPAAMQTPLRELHRIDPRASRASYVTSLFTLENGRNVSAASIVDIQADSPLRSAGLTTNHHIIAVNGREVSSAQGLINRLNNDFQLGETVTLTTLSAGNEAEIDIRLWHPGRRINRVSLGPLLQYQASLDPNSQSLSVIDLWLFSFYSYTRVAEEKRHSILGLITFSSELGELIEEAE